MLQFKREHIATSDEELIRFYKQSGDMNHVTDLYSKYIELVFGVCLKYFKNEADSEDAVMQIYEKLTVKLTEHEVSNFKGWLAILTKNHCISTLQQEKRKKDKEREYIEFKLPQKEEAELFPIDLKEEQLTKLDSCIQHLINSQKECITKFYLEQLSYNEIANQLSMSWSRVRSLIQNGRRNLKICIERT